MNEYKFTYGTDKLPHKNFLAHSARRERLIKKYIYITKYSMNGYEIAGICPVRKVPYTYICYLLVTCMQMVSRFGLAVRR